MSIETVEITSPGSFSVVEIRQGPAGTGGGGSNSVTSATTSDGTADLSLLNVTTATATVSGTLTANHIHGNLAGSVYAHVRAGEALLKGDPVYVSGFNNGTSTAEVSKADASNAAKMPAIGIMDADLAHNATGHMVITGTITDVNTAGYAVNAELYVAAGGGMTATPPTARAQPVARVERVNINNGAIIVKVNGLSASDNTPSTLVRRNANGDASFSAVDVSTLTAAGISSDGLVSFNGTGAGDSLTFNMVNYTYGAGAASAHRFALNGGAATGDALFTAASPAAARTTLELGSLATINSPLPVANGGTGTTNGSITGTGALTFTAGGSSFIDLVGGPTGSTTDIVRLKSGNSNTASSIAFLKSSDGSLQGSFGGLNSSNEVFFFSSVSYPLTFYPAGTKRLTFSTQGNILVGTTADTGLTGAGGMRLASTTASTSTTTGALVVSGGAGIAGAVNSLYQRVGSGTPEGVVTAPIGAVFHRTDGGAGTSFYVKESGTGNTGWVAK